MRNGKKSHVEPTPASPDFDEDENEILEAHVAKLVKAGRVVIGEGGPPIPEILRPGPRVPNASRAIRQDRRRR